MSTFPEQDQTEDVLRFGRAGEEIVAILHTPADEAALHALAVVVVVGGPQYRVGSHRQFVHLARRLAAHGHAALRFDLRGMGDSGGPLPHFEHAGPDIAAAIDALCARLPQVNGVVLWGLCDGASAALLYLDEYRDARVRGLCLANPWVRREASYARMTLRHYYARRLLQASFWRKVIGGGVPVRTVGELAASAQSALFGGAPRRNEAFQERMLRAWTAFRGRTLIVLSGQDLTAREFAHLCAVDRRWTAALARPWVMCAEFADADHTFSSATEQRAVETATLQWLHAA
jgi:exosortase A-associated hydrolase 1